MKKYFKSALWFVLLALLATIVIQFFLSPMLKAQREEAREFKFKKIKGVTIPVLSRESFKQKFGDNPLVPKTKEEIIKLARKIYIAPEIKPVKELCGEFTNGALFAALSNPDISDEDRFEIGGIIMTEYPVLEQTYTEGHFKFFYTTIVSLNDIKATAKILNDAWDDFACNFKEPKHYTTGGGCSPIKRWIDVKVYDIPYLGVTASYWDYIKLDNTVVEDSCLRKTVPVHELFHRVQYRYGYETGYPIKWATEGTAVWSQKYRASEVGDWMDWMNQGLNTPDRDLIQERMYDAVHFWVYFGQFHLCKGEMRTIKKVWSTFQTNGNNMKEAVTTTIQSCTEGAIMDHLVLWWALTNFHKDMSNATQIFDYDEDEWRRTCDTIDHGPLTEVPRTTETLNVGSNHSIAGTVDPYGADYYVFSVGATVTSIEINVTASTQNFAYGIDEIKNDNYMHFQHTTTGTKDFEYNKDYTQGQLSHIALIVIGNPNGGNYTVTAKGF